MLPRKGFTLIELLIVVSILGILSAIIISVINPDSSRRKARDATVVTAMSKVIIGIESFHSAYNRIPDSARRVCNCTDPSRKCEIFDVLNENVVSCFNVQDQSGYSKIFFTINGIKEGTELVPGYDMDDSDTIRYMPNYDGCVSAMSLADSPKVFVYKRSRGELMLCDAGTGSDPTLRSCTSGTIYPNNCESIN